MGRCPYRVGLLADDLSFGILGMNLIRILCQERVVTHENFIVK